MWLALVVALLFLGGAAFNVFGREPNHSEALTGAGIATALIALFFFERFHRRKHEEFDHWLVTNASVIQSGGAHYGGVLITPATILTRYQATLSFLLVTFKIPTRWYIVDHDATQFVAVVCTLVSLVFGWWGIPWGPVYTIQAVSHNVRGGFRQTVAERFSGTAAM